MGLKGIPSIISPDLLKILAEMGHGDRIVLADSHFPGTSIGAKSNIQVIRADGLTSIPKLMTGIMKLMELDSYCEEPCTLMDRTDGDKAKNVVVPNWPLYVKIAEEWMGKREIFHYAERNNFYKMAGEAYAIVMTGDTSIYGNIILTKGVTHGLTLN